MNAAGQVWHEVQLLKISLRKEKNRLACHGYILCSVRKQTYHTIFFYSAGCSQSLGVVSEGMANKRRVKGKGKQTKEKEMGLLVEYIKRVNTWKYKVRKCPALVSRFKQHSKNRN